MEREKYAPWNTYIYHKANYTKEDAIRIVDEWVDSETCGKVWSQGSVNKIGKCVDGPLKGCVMELTRSYNEVCIGAGKDCTMVTYAAKIKEKDGMCNFVWELHSEYPRKKEPKATFINPDFVYDPRIAEPLF